MRLATLFHDLGKPAAAADEDRAERGARLAASALRRLRYPTGLRQRVVRIVRFHPFLLGEGDAGEARRMLARYGDGLTFDLIDHWEVDLHGRNVTEAVEAKLARVAAFRKVVEQELTSPHRLADLAVDGADLIQLGYRPGPQLGETLKTLLDEVIEEPLLNRRELLLNRAGELLQPRDPLGRARAVPRRLHHARRAGSAPGSFASLNLGSREDEPARIAENRRLACAELALDADRRIAVNRQRHTAIRCSEPCGRARCTTRSAMPSGRVSPASRCSRSAPTASRSRSWRRAASLRPSRSFTPAGAGSRTGSSKCGRRRARRRGPPPRSSARPIGLPCCYEVGPEVFALGSTTT